MPDAKSEPGPESPPPATSGGPRIVSIDALRGLVMFAMIFVNDLAGAPHEVVPWWMRHFKADGDGMTFVDLVFPAFLFITGMSIPPALGARMKKGESTGRILWHVVLRVMALLLIGVVMVNESPDSAKMGWSANLWSTLMYLSAILAFSTLVPRRAAGPEAAVRVISLGLRILGFAVLAFLIWAFRGGDGHRIVAFSPFSIHTEWYGILGLIGWAYLVGATVFLLFGTSRVALLGCVALLLCLYPADRTGAFNHFWLSRFVGIGETLGSQAAITVAGVLLASILFAPDMSTTGSRARFALLFAGSSAAGAMLLRGLYGINKNSATPSWCLWACAITGLIWLGLHLVCDVRPAGFVPKSLALAGSNVLLAYLLSEMLPSAIDLFHFGAGYDRLASLGLFWAIGRSAVCGVAILGVSTALNRAGFRLKI
jgi:predicted acyltransferase